MARRKVDPTPASQALKRLFNAEDARSRRMCAELIGRVDRILLWKYRREIVRPRIENATIIQQIARIPVSDWLPTKRKGRAA